MLKLLENSLVLRTREFTDIFITFDEIYLVFTSKKSISSMYSITSISSEKAKLGISTADLFKLLCLQIGMRWFFLLYLFLFIFFFYFYLFCLFFLLFFLIGSLEYLDIVLSEIKDMSETAFSAPFSLTLNETTLSELVKFYFLKKIHGRIPILFH